MEKKVRSILLVMDKRMTILLKTPEKKQSEGFVGEVQITIDSAKVHKTATSGSHGDEFGLSIQVGKPSEFEQRLEVSECFVDIVVAGKILEDSQSKVQPSNPGGRGIILDLDY
ncbi:hypothetical protein MANES_04G036850v8 [Manihot esculenta]|uniref:Uncharacterized protein n=1 Tax=Manihot esculenta TaxID=3983 RepID=A0ACB7HX61_MANES|nr:hypothetical protein MANES_04G036850v8 [Manihot esculenta]